MHFAHTKQLSCPACRWKLPWRATTAQLNLVNMRHGRNQRAQIYGQALRGLMTLETDVDRQLKYADFIDIFGALDAASEARLRGADEEAPRRWTRNLLSAQRLEDVFREQWGLVGRRFLASTAATLPCREALACACQPSVPVAAYPDAEGQVEQAVRRTGFSRFGLIAAARVVRMTGAMVVRGVMAVSVVTV